MNTLIQHYTTLLREKIETSKHNSNNMMTTHPNLYKAWLEHIENTFQTILQDVERFQNITNEDLHTITDPSNTNLIFIQNVIKEILSKE